MVRFIFDAYGNSHQDVFLKIDVSVGNNNLQIVDFYFIPDFLNFESQTTNIIDWKKECFKEFLNFWIKTINLNLDKTYLVFGLFDQGVSAIKLEKSIKNKVIFYKITIVHSHKNYGWSMNNKMNQNEFIDFEWDNIDENYWEFTKEEIIKGLYLSIDYLK